MPNSNKIGTVYAKKRLYTNQTLHRTSVADPKFTNIQRFLAVGAVIEQLAAGNAL
jgi:hypothetical protein